MLEELFQHLAESRSIANDLKDLTGRAFGLQLGVVTSNEDPLGLARIKATVSNLGAKTDTDWLYRLVPCPKISLPVPTIGETVVVGYLDGDPHKGIYLGTNQNLLNPAGPKTDFILTIGEKVQIHATPESIKLTVGSSSILIEPTQITQTVEGSSQVQALDPLHPGKTIVTWTGVHLFSIDGQIKHKDASHP